MIDEKHSFFKAMSLVGVHQQFMMPQFHRYVRAFYIYLYVVIHLDIGLVKK